VDLDALLLQIADGGIDVVNSDREVVRTGRLGVRLHQVHLLAAGVEPVPRAEIGARQLRHAEHVAVKGETLLRVGDADGDMMYTGWLHRSILPQQQLQPPQGGIWPAVIHRVTDHPTWSWGPFPSAIATAPLNKPEG
jgi:hypothetical protein